MRNWKVWLAFWAFAISDADFAAEQYLQVVRVGVLVAEGLAGDRRYRHLASRERIDAARDLVTLAIGVALQAAFDPEDWPKPGQVGPMADRLRRLARIDADGTDARRRLPHHPRAARRA